MPLKGRKAHVERMRRLTSPSALRQIGAVVHAGADAIRAEAHRSISRGSSSGRSGGKHQHVASRPGEPPNRDTGDLQAKLKTVKDGPLAAQVLSEAEHSEPLELGTSKMEARPFLRPARDKLAPEIRRDMARRINRIVKENS